MHAVRSLIPLALLAAALLVPARPAEAVSPRNPYSSFNLSGVNYGAMQWERAVTVHTPGRQISGNWPFLKGRLQPQKGHVAANHRRADFEVAARRPGSGAVVDG